MKLFTLLLFISAAIALPRAPPILLNNDCPKVRTVTRTQIHTRLVTVTGRSPQPTPNRGNNNNNGSSRRGRNDNDGRGGRDDRNDGRGGRNDRNDGRGGQNNGRRPGQNNNGGGRNNSPPRPPPRPTQPTKGAGTQNNGGNNNGNNKTTSTSVRGGQQTAASTSRGGNTQATSTSAAQPAETNGNGGGGNNDDDGGNNNDDGGNNDDERDPQKSLKLLESQVQTNLFKDGQETPTEGQVASLTSRNNFINFCDTQKVPLTNGLQIEDGSCNPTPMGRIIAKNKVPSSKFVFPLNFSKIKADQPFTIKMAVKGIQTGNFVNPATNYYAAPAQVNGNGEVIGHSHIVVEKIEDLQSTQPTDPTVFAFFKGVNSAAVNGVLSADVTKGLPKGVYRLSSINAAMNHQPILGAVAQRGAIDDAVYFTVE